MLRKRPSFSFTLMELILVVGLLVLVLTTLRFPFMKALRSEQGKSDVEKIVNKLILAQEIMLDYHTDVIVKFTQNNDIWHIQLLTAKPLPLALEKMMNRGNSLARIEALSFNDKPLASGDSLFFYAAEDMTPCGVLKIKTDVFCNLYLKGYPAPMGRKEEIEISPKEINYPQVLLPAV